LHLIDLPRQNKSINFVSDLSEIPRSLVLPEAAKSDPPVDPNSRLAQEIRHLQSENKQQYKRLADAVGKADQYSRVQQALELDKHLKAKGKKRQVEVGGKTMYRWFGERKR
jgi:hypothetical protein